MLFTHLLMVAPIKRGLRLAAGEITGGRGPPEVTLFGPRRVLPLCNGLTGWQGVGAASMRRTVRTAEGPPAF